MGSTPQTFKEVFDFYYKFVKPVYSSIQVENALPIETLFEINAAFDHLSRHWFYGDAEAGAAEKAYAHLKRSCLDIFKLEVKRVMEEYQELRKVDTSILDNGDYDRKLVAVRNTIRTEAILARTQEGDTRSDDHAQMVRSFEVWLPVYKRWVEFHQEFYLHPRLDWAKRKGFWKRLGERTTAFVVGFIAGLCSRMAASWLARYCGLFK